MLDYSVFYMFYFDWRTNTCMECHKYLY